MAQHWKGVQRRPDIDPFEPRDRAAYEKLPPLARRAVDHHHGDWLRLQTAFESAISDYPQREQSRYRRLILKCFGLKPATAKQRRQVRARVARALDQLSDQPVSNEEKAASTSSLE